MRHSCSCSTDLSIFLQVPTTLSHDSSNLHQSLLEACWTMAPIALDISGNACSAKSRRLDPLVGFVLAFILVILHCLGFKPLLLQ